MITVRRADTRHHDRRGKRDVWSTFDPRNRGDALADGFGALEIVCENRLPPGAGLPHRPRRADEIVTYVREGAVAYTDSLGDSGVIQTGEFQHLTTAGATRHREANASRAHWAHVFQIGFHAPTIGLEAGREQKRFTSAQRSGGLCVVASPDARGQSLRIHQDVLMYSAILESGQHVVHELAPTRRAWLHVVAGQAILGGFILSDGDSASLTTERAVSMTARDHTEVLLFDVCEQTARPVTCTAGMHDDR